MIQKSNINHAQRKTYHTFESAQLECNKYNSNSDNLGKRRKNPYLCKICGEFHRGKDNKKTITFTVREKALSQINEYINNYYSK